MANLRYLVAFALPAMLLGGCASQPPLAPSSSDAEFAKAAADIRKSHPKGGEAMWKALVAVVEPGMNAHQMILLLPDYSDHVAAWWPVFIDTASSDGGPYVYYNVDKEFAVRARTHAPFVHRGELIMAGNMCTWGPTDVVVIEKPVLIRADARR